MAYFEEGNITSTSIQVRLCDITTSYESRSIIWYIDGEDYSTTSLSDGNANSNWITFSGLKPDYSYEIQADVYGWIPGLGQTRIVWCSDAFTTEADPDQGNRPEYFEWTYSKKSGKEFKLTAKEWNALCDHINELLDYYDMWDEYFTPAVSGEAFTADMFNEILDAIYPISPRTSSYLQSYKVEPGDIVYAWLLNDLVSLVNEC